ncbi:MAG: hypothetical protein R3F20_14180 [Planctomycetota bacterium]
MALEEHLPEGVTPPDLPSSEAGFWTFFWDRDITPWDLGEAHPEFRRRADELCDDRADGERGEAIVPGCGAGHDAMLLAGLGWAVTAMDFAAPAAGIDVGLAGAGGRYLREDVFAHADEGRYRLWLEHTFFCAIPPERRADWGAAAGRLLAPGGRLAALVFPVGKPAEEGGPPFGLTVADMSAALGERFELVLDEEVIDRAESRGRAERFAIWRRRDS